MAQDPVTLLSPDPVTEDAQEAPLGGTRAQSIQRLQIGLFGLFAMVLLVGLANIIMDNAAENQARVVPEAAPMANAPEVAPATDPLADAGVVPDLPAQPLPQPATPPSLEGDEVDEPASIEP